jgi:hypothetical protein
MSTIYRIAKWEESYESADSRKISGPLSWIRFKTKQDGSGYRRIISQPDNCEIFSAWIAMVQISAKLPKELRGSLVSSDSRPLDVDDLAGMSGFPPKIFVRALEFLSSQKMGWLVCEKIKNSGATRHPPKKQRRYPASAEKTAATPGIRGKNGGDTRHPRKKPPREEERREDKISCAGPEAGASDRLFEALTKAEGSNPAEITPKASSRINAALTEILIATPHVTPEEITNRAAKYHRIMQPNNRLTAHALAKHWSRCGEPKDPAKPAIPTPPQNWRDILEELYAHNRINRDGIAWKDVHPQVREEVIEKAKQGIDGIQKKSAGPPEMSVGR